MIRSVLTAVLCLPVLAFAGGEAPARSGNFVCNGGHYRCQSKPEEYGYHQFAMRRIKDFAGYSDLLPPGEPLEHYQSFLAELDSRRADTNAVAFWADAMARAHKARVWGAFASARSELPKGQDAQLIGLEIDVLNDGLPGVHPNQSKVGLQIVGFGRTNTNAIEVLAQSRDSGRFSNIFNVQPNAATEDGAIFGIAPQQTGVGLNMLGSTFRDSAILLSANAPLTFRGTEGQRDARIYRDNIDSGHLVLQASGSGIRITNSANEANLLVIDDRGNIRPDSLVAGKLLWTAKLFAGLLLLSLLLNALALGLIWRMRATARRARTEGGGSKSAM